VVSSSHVMDPAWTSSLSSYFLWLRRHPSDAAPFPYLFRQVFVFELNGFESWVILLLGLCYSKLMIKIRLNKSVSQRLFLFHFGPLKKISFTLVLYWYLWQSIWSFSSIFSHKPLTFEHVVK
jgi:hypothetical protein